MALANFKQIQGMPKISNDVTTIYNSFTEIDNNVTLTKNNADTATTAATNANASATAAKTSETNIQTIFEKITYSFVQRSKDYVIGDIAYSFDLPTWARLECVIAGKTADTQPNLSATTNGNLITDGTVTWIIDDIRDSNIVGNVIPCTYLPTGYIKANGATVLRKDYPRLVNLATKYNLWTNDTTNNLGLFGVGDGTTTMVLPNWTDRMAQYAVLAGTTISAGLPNVTGNVTSNVGDASASGALQSAEASFIPVGYSGKGSSNLTLNAANSSSVYGNSTTVQPAAITVLPIIKY
jgi:hypothetical protein